METGLHLELITQSLLKERLDPSFVPGWLEQSYEHPEAFLKALAETRNAFSPWKGKSAPFRTYNVYHDIVIRNRRLNTPVFCWYDSFSGWRRLTYPELGERSAAKADAWESMGVSPGQSLCTILPLGPELLSALLAAFKLGLTITLLPPAGLRYIENRLAALQPDFIVTDEFLPDRLPEWRDKILTIRGETPVSMKDDESDHAYSSGEMIARCFDPCMTNYREPVPLTVDRLYLNAIRDGIIGMGVKPGSMVAAPGFNFLETQPGLLMSILLNGAAFVHIKPEDIARDPELLLHYPLRAVGISSAVRDILIKKPVDPGTTWAYWFRNPADSPDLVQWQTFLETMKLQNTPAGNMKWDASIGGASLFSERRKGQVHSNVFASAGSVWRMTDTGGTGSEVPGDAGLLSIGPDAAEAPPVILNHLVMKTRDGLLFIQSTVSGRKGLYYPVDEILETIGDIPFCSDCAIVEVPLYGDMDSRFVLLVFTGAARRIDEAFVVNAVQEKIAIELDRELIPDRIIFFPLYPRRTPEGLADPDWIREQYLTGALKRKSEDDIFQRLTQLKQFVYPRKG